MPKSRPKPPQAEQHQSHVPGLTAQMTPKPDHGETTYIGSENWPANRPLSPVGIAVLAAR